MQLRNWNRHKTINQMGDALMQNVLIKEHKEIALVRLNNSATNSLSADLVAEMAQALEFVKDRFKGMVLAGGDKFFSMGFDIPSLLKCSQEEMTGYFNHINQVWLDLYTLPVPTVAAVKAHAIAGGTIFAMMCDWRVAASGRTLFGLNEIKLGVPVPYLSDLVLRQLAGERAADEMVFTGEFLDSAKALEVGLVDQVVEKDEVEESALQRVLQLATMPRAAFQEIKSMRVERIAALYKENHEKRNANFLEMWLDEKTRPILEEAAKKF
jgi:enoyl-CoA hydratase/carnithine racemase